MEGISTEVITFSNIGDLFKIFVDFVDRNKTIPTPAIIGVDHSKIQIDGLTNYTWLVREGIKLTADFKAGHVASAGKVSPGEFGGRKGVWNNYGEFTEYGKENPANGMTYYADGTSKKTGKGVM
jgi:hypothetical protein